MGLIAPLPERWDGSVDVVVVGYGYAGAVSAISAHDHGAEVLLLEKGPTPGGISICSVGGIRVSNNADATLAYLRRTNQNTVPDALLQTFAEGMTRLPALVDKLAAEAEVEIRRRAAPGNYPFDGYDSFGFLNVEPIEGFDPLQAYPDVEGSPEGARLFQMLERNIARRRISVRLRAPVSSLVIDEHGGVRGVVAKHEGVRSVIEARTGVILASGGFEGDLGLQRQHWTTGPVLSAAYRGNTGDGMRMAQAAGADVWHLFHYHGSYGFKLPDPSYPFGIRTKRLPDWVAGAGPPEGVKMPWILLDQRGRRFMNEYEPYMQDTGARPFDRYDPVRQQFAALPAWMILDSDGIGLWPLGRPTWHEAGVGYRWSDHNEAEIANGLIQVAMDIAHLAKLLAVPTDILRNSLERWNEACARGADLDWDRPPPSMLPIARAPFYVAPMWPIVSNTQGGPAHDARQRVLQPDGVPIANLYAAGEMGSLFGHLYLSGGNIAECFWGGWVAGREISVREIKANRSP